jgi:hypothetical protein
MEPVSTTSIALRCSSVKVPLSGLQNLYVLPVFSDRSEPLTRCTRTRLIFNTCVAPAGEQLRLSLEDCHAALMGQARPGKLLGRNWMAKPPNRCARRLYQSAPGASVDKQPHQVPALCAQWWTTVAVKSLAGNECQSPVDCNLSVEVRPPYSPKLLIASIFYTL